MASSPSYTREDLINLAPSRQAFVGIDSDGCVFDSMEIKQKKCFHPLIISHWKLERIAEYVREAAQFANLYSKWRGQNRFPALIMTFDLLRERPEVRESGVPIPELSSLRKFVASGAALGNPDLERAVEETRDPELLSVLEWSKAVNDLIARTVKKVPPFQWARRSLEKIAAHADAICVSQTPAEALIREWDENGITPFVRIIAGQELGTKADHIRLAAGGKYPPEKILMIGDAPGDKKAAKANNAMFYPINPGREEESWKRFHEEAFDRFLAGKYAGAYEAELIEEFDALLPDIPPWKKSARR